MLQQRGISFNGRLYVFGVNCRPSIYTSLGSDGTWAPTAFIPGAGVGGSFVGLATYRNRLYAMWRATDTNTSLFYASMDTSGVWSATARLSTGESRSWPSAAVMVGDDGQPYLYAFWLDRNGGAQSMWYARMDATLKWSAVTRLTQDWPLSELAPNAGASPSGIYLTYKGGYNDNLYYKKLGTNQQWLTEIDTGWDLTDASPSVVHFNGMTWLFYRYKYVRDYYWYVRYQIIN